MDFAAEHGMDKQRMTFEIDRRTVTEGDVAEVTWQCDGAEQVTLTIDNGFRTASMPLASSGSKKFRLNRSKGRTRLTIAVVQGGRTFTKKLSVRVKKMPVMRAETVDHRGRRQSGFGLWWAKQWGKIRLFFGRLRSELRTLPERKQLAAKLLAIMGVLLILSSVWPRVYSFGMLFLVGYLGFVLLRQ